MIVGSAGCTADGDEPGVGKGRPGPEIFGQGIGTLDGVRVVTVDYPTDVTDPRRLAGFADAIFTGWVGPVGPAAEVDGMPWTMGRVEVIESLKGSASGTVTVEQQGGLDASGALYYVENTPRIDSGRTYLFAARKSDHDAYVLVSPQGIIPLGANPDSQLAHMRDAISNAIPYP